MKLIAPQHVKPYVTRNKNDYIDSEAICEAASRPRTRYVAIKTVEQQVLSTQHRLREALVGHRTQTINRIHGFLLEFGIVIPCNKSGDESSSPASGHDPAAELPQQLEESFIEHLLEEMKRLNDEIKAIDRSIKEQVEADDAGTRLMSIPGIGPIIASALLADVGTLSNFHSSRDFAASLGLVPRQYSTGGKTVLLNISKRGDKYLRKLMIQGSRAVLVHIDKRTDALGTWCRDLLIRKHPNKVACALANKLARIVWAVLARGVSYNAPSMA